MAPPSTPVPLSTAPLPTRGPPPPPRVPGPHPFDSTQLAWLDDSAAGQESSANAMSPRPPHPFVYRHDGLLGNTRN
ncbi:hypothetical protein GUJ93_ZPchr0004g38544 [Zizania palustris]|uniref:Uncharacterized protein n=1 Tax=Zizania palustris TaxID=103762 RepID=A0A8J5VNB6_ZIZPA|nr:hypothetical protein GUJ93_ZPchr0004g38544 [Zizania palustris]